MQLNGCFFFHRGFISLIAMARQARESTGDATQGAAFGRRAQLRRADQISEGCP